MTLVAVGQMCSSASLRANLTSALNLINKAAQKKARLLFLPEAADYISRDASHSVKIAKPVEESVFVKGIQKRLNELHVSGTSLDVIVGVHDPVLDEKPVKRVKNLVLYINSRGEITQSYQKIHLFDINVPGGPVMRESASVEPGKKLTEPFDTPAGKLGLSICYDIRFPEQAIKLRELGANIITYPSAFMVATGSAHWELLARSRAIDSQCYVVMPAQAGAHNTDVDDEGGNEKLKKVRRSYGHSMVVDPWGVVLGRLEEEEEEILVVDLEMDNLERVRRDMPLMDHRKGVNLV